MGIKLDYKGGQTGKAGHIYHSRPEQIDHDRALIVNRLGLSSKIGGMWSRQLVFPSIPLFS